MLSCGGAEDGGSEDGGTRPGEFFKIDSLLWRQRPVSNARSAAGLRKIVRI
jgi:hypothetical protein